MQPFWKLTAFFSKVYFAAGVLLWTSCKLEPTSSLVGVVTRGLIAFAISFGILFLDEVYIYPRFRSPFRNLPIVNSGYDLRIVLEGPRGKTALKWFSAMPEVDLINSRGKYGQTMLYPVSIEALRDVMATRAYDFEKPQGLRSFLAPMLGWEGLIVTEAANHRAQRRALTPSFNIKHIRALHPVMYRKAIELVTRMEADMRLSRKVDLPAWSSRFALDVIGHAALSEDFNALGMEEYHPVAQSFCTLMQPEPYLMIFLGLCIVFPPWITSSLPLKAKRVIARASDVVRKAADKIYEQQRLEQQHHVTEKAEQVVQENNILGNIMKSSGFSKADILDQIQTIIGAGHETSAVSIVWACHLLTLPENRHYQDLLRQEIRAALSSVPEASADFPSVLAQVVETSPYLHGICEEVLRLFPPVPATLRESVRQTSIAGTVVPKGTMIIIMAYAINRNPKFWGSDADQFRPERWIDTLSDGSLRANKSGGAESNFCEVTFLHGPRACLGRDFAKAELKCALMALFGYYELSRLPGDDGSVKVKGSVTIKPQQGLELQIKRVEGF